MHRIKECLEKRIGERFGLKVAVSKKPSRVGEDGIPHVRMATAVGSLFTQMKTALSAMSQAAFASDPAKAAANMSNRKPD